ncbi:MULTISPECIES: type III PLP-dependent enzyme domain-containing protein [Streptomyces]|uniref:alanine racemase n=1 Tax=Streptomyces TaxID=1883 RepID=UPI00051912EE|nr:MULTISPECIES: alanine racemase [Streptomyces]KOT65489.1 diaminopimelate decarboxylase [Streptomyces rimosus subsp. rimosus]
MDVPLYLEPRLESRLASLLRARTFLHMLAGGLGSPLNVVLPDRIAENLAAFRAVYRRHHLGGVIHFAHKANRSSALVRRLAATDAGMDVASLGELQHALGSGFAPDRILATGPKNAEFLWLAARSGTAVHIDSPGELDALAALVRDHGLPRVSILLRLSGFRAPGVRLLTRQSRFGTAEGDLDGLLKSVERHGDAVELTGVGYHLDTTSPAEKAVALEGCVKALDTCRARGFTPRAVDIGGGFGTDYLADGGQWQRYTTELTNAALGTRPPMTWRRHTYGLRNENGTLRGALALYPAHRPTAGAQYLDALLSLPAPSLGRPLATLLLENLYELHTEPGRALVDQCGVTLARVLEVRRTQATEGEPAACDRTAPDHLLVRLDANADDIGLEEHGVLVDPVLVPRDAGPGPDSGPVAVYLAGNLCLEADMITRRAVHLPAAPRPGDLLAFANTAGYCMDFSADEAQQQPVARKVAVWQERAADGPGQEDAPWHWCLDEQYWPHLSRRTKGTA